LELPAITVTDGPHGLRRQPDDADHLGIGDSVPATCFPTASNLAASWDLELVEAAAAALAGKPLTDRSLADMEAAVAAACKPISDKRGTAEYRTKVASVLARRAATIAFERARA
jgi:hypothetical protein